MRFTRKSTQKSSRRTPQKSSSKLHSYYTAAQQERIEIDMSERRSKKRSEKLHTARSKVEKLVIVGFVVFVLYMLLALKGEPLVLVDTKATKIDPSRYSSRVEQALQSSILNTNKITLQRHAIETLLSAEFPEINTIEVRTSFVGKRPEVKITLHDIPYAYEVLTKRHLLSDKGVNIGLSEEFPAATGQILIIDESGVQTNKGDDVLRSDDAKFITTVDSLITSKGRAVEYAKLTSVPREVYIKLSDVNYVVRMYLEEDAREQIGTFFAAEKTLGEGGVVPTQYVDVRAGEKVFWK